MFAVSLGMTVHGVFSSKEKASEFLKIIDRVQIFDNQIVPDLFEIKEEDLVLVDERWFFRGTEVLAFFD
jgi:hypothetical protein